MFIIESTLTNDKCTLNNKIQFICNNNWIVFKPHSSHDWRGDSMWKVSEIDVCHLGQAPCCCCPLIFVTPRNLCLDRPIPVSLHLLFPDFLAAPNAWTLIRAVPGSRSNALDSVENSPKVFLLDSQYILDEVWWVACEWTFLQEEGRMRLNNHLFDCPPLFS